MARVVHSARFSSDWRVTLPEEALGAVEASADGRALVRGDGMIGHLNDTMLRTLGFEPGDDLRGLRFGALWDHETRGTVAPAMRAALEEGEAALDLDLAYLTGRPRRCRVHLRRVDAAMIEASLRCLDRDGDARRDGHEDGSGR